MTASEYCEQGRKMMDVGNLVVAMEYFQAAIETDKHFEKAYFLLATAYEKQGKLDKAKSALYALLAVDPKDPQALRRIDKLNGKVVTTSQNISSETSTIIQSNVPNPSNSSVSNNSNSQQQSNRVGNYRIFDGKQKDSFHFFIMFDDGNRLYFILQNNQLAVIRPNTKPFIGGWEGYARPKGKLVVPSEIVYKGSCLKVESIKWKAFDGCYELTSVVLPNTIRILENRCFSHCSRLTRINLPSSINTIGCDAFEYCQSLSRIDLPSSLSVIECESFKYCDNLEFVTIPASVNRIVRDAFRPLFSKKELCLIMGGLPPICDEGLGRNDVLVKVPKGTLEAYLTAPFWQCLNIQEET